MAHSAKEAGRAQILIKKRQKEQEELEAKKRKIEDELRVGSITNKFAAHYDAIEQRLKSDTIGRHCTFHFKHSVNCYSNSLVKVMLQSMKN